MIADMIVFAIMAYFYVPYDPSEASTQIDNDSNEEKKQSMNGKSNKEEVNGVSPIKNGITNDGLNEEDTKF